MWQWNNSEVTEEKWDYSQIGECTHPVEKGFDRACQSAVWTQLVSVQIVRP